MITHRPPEFLCFLLGLGILFLPFSCRDAVSRDASSVEKTRARLSADEKKILYGKSLLKDGDLVLRTGNDFISLTLRQFSMKNKTYSHCGIVRIQQGKVFVYHAIGGEDNPDARLRRDRFEQFCNPGHNLGFGIFRYKLDASQQHRLDSLVAMYYRLRIRFDLRFDLKTDSSFYCAEFVYKVLEGATGQPGYLPLSHIGNFRYVAIDNLFLNPHTTAIYQTVFR